LSNVYLGGTPKLRLLTAARAVAPPIGMLIVCTIPVVPRAPRRGFTLGFVEDWSLIFVAYPMYNWITGWWFGTFFVTLYWECHHPN
jgi:hypothetical protein